MSTFFTSAVDHDVLTITLTKPKQHNVLNPAEMNTLREFLNEASSNTKLRAGILTGLGKSFCAGANLGELKEYDFDQNPLEMLTDQIEAIPFPVICKLNGGVYGGGTDIALACDFRIGTPQMKCFVPPAKIGIHYHAAGMARAVSRLGLGPTKRLFLALETMDGRELKNIGFLDYIVDEADLDARTEKLVTDIVALAPLSLVGMKATFNQIAKGTFDKDVSRSAQLVCLHSDDFKEGQVALAEKRPPNFKGS